jgi:hypothetical protein
VLVARELGGRAGGDSGRRPQIDDVAESSAAELAGERHEHRAFFAEATVCETYRP